MNKFDNSDLPTELHIRDLVETLIRNIKFIIIFTAIFAIFSVTYALSLDDIYQSTGKYYTVSKQQSQSTGGGLGGLASLAGIKLGSPEITRKSLAIETIKSRAFLKRLIEKNEEFLPLLMASKSFNKSLGTIIYNEEIFDETSFTWQHDKESQISLKPKFIDIQKKYNGSLKIDQDLETGIITIGFFHLSPKVSYELLSFILDEINLSLKENELQEAMKALEYLSAYSTNILAVQNSVAQLIEKQVETQMLANIRKDYALKALDPAMVPEIKSLPKRAMICIIITMFGFMLSIVWVLTREYFFKPKI